MHNRHCAVACLLLASLSAQARRESAAELPSLLRCEDGTAVTSVAQWPRRRAELRSLMLQHFTGTLPAETPAILAVESTPERRHDSSLRRRVRLTLDTPQGFVLEFHVWRPVDADRPTPLLLTQPRDYQLGWAELAVQRGYTVCLYQGIDSHHRNEAFPGYDSAWQQLIGQYPNATWTEIVCKAWIAGRCLDHLLDDANGFDIAPDQVGIIGFSRYGKQSLIAAAIDPRITSVVARSPGSPGSTPYRFSSRDTFAESPADFPGRWFLPSLRDYAGREHELPMDAHAWLALIAPRRCLIHTAHNDGSEPTFGVERAWLAAREVYRLHGREEHLRVAYRTGQHGPITAEHRRQNLDWFDLSFGRGDAKPSDFPVELLHDFDWQSWRSRQPAEALAAPQRPSGDPDPGAVRRSVEWMLGRPPASIPAASEQPFLSVAESEMMTHDRWRVPGVARVPIRFGHGVRGNLYMPEGASAPLPVVIWLHPYSYHSGYNEGYGVQGTTVYHRLAAAGFAVLAYDQCGFGLRLLEGRDFCDANPQWSRLGRMVHDVRAAVDFVHGAGASQGARPELDARRIFALGYSMGGTVALHAAALDARIHAVACFAGFTPMRTDTDDRATGGNQRLWQWHALLPRLGLFAGREPQIPYDYDDLLRLIGPRPCLVVSPRDDRHATLADVTSCVQRAKAGGATGLTFETPPGPSRFQKAQHETFVRWALRR